MLFAFADSLVSSDVASAARAPHVDDLAPSGIYLSRLLFAFADGLVSSDALLTLLLRCRVLVGVGCSLRSPTVFFLPVRCSHYSCVAGYLLVPCSLRSPTVLLIIDLALAACFAASASCFICTVCASALPVASRAQIACATYCLLVSPAESCSSLALRIWLPHQGQ